MKSKKTSQNPASVSKTETNTAKNNDLPVKDGYMRSLDILDHISTSYIELDLNGRLTFVNDNACRNLGYSRDELIGMHFSEFTTDEHINEQIKNFNEIYRTGKSKTLPTSELVRKDGSHFFIEHSANIMRNQTGKIIGYYGVSRDITERIKAEEALRKSEEKYRTILESMNEMYIEHDLKGNITFVNEAACLTGYDREELLGKNYRDFFSNEGELDIKNVFSSIYETGKPKLMRNFEMIMKDGSIRNYQGDIRLLFDTSGAKTGFRTLARDVTDYVKAEEEKARIEEQFYQSQKMESVGRLAGGIAHDFNNMLTVILGYTELITLKLTQDNPLLGDIHEIEKAAIRSRDITRQLLAFSRKEIIAPEPIDLNDLIEGVEKTLLSLIGEDIDLKFYPGDNLWTIKVDPSQMQQILMNFSINARDAMSEGGKLTIETENIRLNEAYCKIHPEFAPGDYVLLGVSDDGIGMDHETISHIFEPFFTTKEKGRGTGLGLATVYGIVKQNEGFINVYSEPGSGTTFKIYFPRTINKSINAAITEDPNPRRETGIILLVEDNEMVRTMTTEMLEAIGYTVVATPSPKEALEFFDQPEFIVDLVITDVVMPQMNGRELGEQIAGLRPGTKILFMSGYTANVIVHRGVLTDGVNFIHKPFSMNDLANKVRNAIKKD